MLRSMTAFGRSESTHEWGVLVWEVRSVNHRYLECGVRLPDELRALEPQVRERVGSRVRRGKVECALRWRREAAASVEIEVNQALAESVLKACQLLEEPMMNAQRISAMDILRWPGVVKEPEIDMQPVQQAVMSELDAVLDDFVAAREREGAQIRDLLLTRCDTIETLIGEQRARNPQAYERWKEKLLARLAEIDAEPDQGRLEQELVYVAQKMDVDEELDRLAAHVAELRRVTGLDEPVGRRLDFLMQEFNRESNTLGSKSTDAETTQNAIDLKVLIEQMREQIQNLE